MAKRIDRTGQEGINNFGSTIVITRYNNKRDIDIYFPEYNWTAYNKQYGQFEKGTIKCPYEPRVYGKGYIGEGNYKSKTSDNTKHTNQYTKWKGMLERCYDPKYSTKNNTYTDCIVCDEWHNFQNFAQWYDNNYYEIENEKMCLDKDILIKGNKIYSPDTCVFVPQSINSLFIKSDKTRGDLPIGVTREHKKYSAQCCNMLGIKRRIGIYNTSEEAFLAYKEAKEETIKMIADHYKNLIPEKLYNAMYEYEVNIND